MSPATLIGAAMRRRRGLRARLEGQVRSAPVTYAYVGILGVTTWALASVGRRLADRVLLAQSTNLHHLARDPLRVLVGSAFWLSRPYELAVVAIVAVLVIARVERRIGGWRTVAVFVAGHVGATLLTAAGLFAALRADAVERGVVNARDVGASYGVLAIVAALTYLLRPSVGLPYAAALLGGLAVVVAVSPTFTNVGHLVAASIGLACRPLVTHGARLRV